MSQHEARWDRTHTLLGYGHARKPAPAAAARAPGVDGVGARVAPTGDVFETDRGPGPGRRVIKLFSWGARLDAEVVRDFTRDAMTVANLRHPHVVQFVEAGALPDGTPFAVMERLPGRTLEEALAEAEPLPASELVPILRGVASALSAAHAAGVVHGDLGADNIFLAEVPGYPRGFPKLLDFGVARLAAAARDPGHARQDLELDAASDRLALAALAHRLLTNGRLADAATVLALDRVLGRAASSPAERFDSVASLLDALEAALTTTGPAPEPAPQPASLTQQFFAEGEQQEAAHAESASGMSDPELESPKLDRIPRSRAPFVATASLVLMSAAVITWTVVSLSTAREASAPASPAPQPAIVAAPSKPLIPSETLETAPGARAPVRRARLANATTHRSRPRTEPASVPAWTTATAPNPPPAPSAPSPSSAPTPAPTPAPEPPSPAAAAPDAPFDEDFTQPWEQTDGEPSGTPAPVDPERETGGDPNTTSP